LERWSVFSISIEIGVPVEISVSPSSSSTTPDSTLTRSSSRRCVTKRDWPGLRLSSSGLDVLQREADAGRAAVDHAAKRRPVALAPGGDAETDDRRCCATCKRAFPDMAAF
jgi:hypothetical protein